MRNSDNVWVEVADELFDPLPPKTGHGGARPGAGRKPKDYVPPEAVEKFDDARARSESAKASLLELDLKVKSGEYLSREAVRAACATAISAFAQTMRSVPDNLERRTGVTPEVAEEVGKAIDAAMNDLADELGVMCDS